MLYIEKQFFEVFEIKPYYKYLLNEYRKGRRIEHLFNKNEFIDFCKTHKEFLLLDVIKRFPCITDEKLLKLICIMNKSELNMPIDGVTVDEIKEKLLHKFINMSVSFKQEIQELFKKED